MFGNNLIGGITRNTLTLPKILNGLSKTLGVVNQAIPLYKQAKPMIEKGRTLFKMATEMAKPSPSSSATKTKVTSSENQRIYQKNIPLKRNVSANKPVFFQ